MTDTADRNNTTERLHALDNLRAAMMWLGIVIHVAVIHMVAPSPLPWHDDRSTPVADLLTAFIHAFRMPVFFILAGFFVALLVQKGGLRGMLKNRLHRLALPFALFWPVLFACVAVLALLFVNRMATGTWGLDRTLMPTGPHIPQGPGTMHLWFLWMLLWFSVLTAPACWLADRVPAIPRMIASAFGRLAGAWWGFLLLSIPLAWVGSFYANGVVAPTGSFVPPLAEWLHNGLFYVFGFYLHRNQQALFALYTRRWPWYAAAGLVFFMATGVLVEMLARSGTEKPHLAWWIALVYNCASWLWSFALIGLFLRYLQRPHAWLGYLCDSSYWVYLAHFPLTIAFGALLYGLPLPALAKIAINVLATTAVCLASYHLFVRFTAISVLLNGRRHARKKLTGETAHAT
ncbi:MAG TPA: acyltransferase family protein [Burkholderiaceae bacterium]|nr:acyltransferase family protein [Burkholderiaceae bacterium]